MFCSKCGTEILKNSAFCSSCGNKIEQVNNTTIKENSKPQNVSTNEQAKLNNETESNTQNIKGSIFSILAFLVIAFIVYNFVFGGGVSNLDGTYKPNTSAGDIYTLVIDDGKATFSEELLGTIETYDVKKEFMSSDFTFEKNGTKVYTVTYNEDNERITCRGNANSMFGSLSIWNKEL